MALAGMGAVTHLLSQQLHTVSANLVSGGGGMTSKLTGMHSAICRAAAATPHTTQHIYRTCRQRLAKRRNSPSSKKHRASVRGAAASNKQHQQQRHCSCDHHAAACGSALPASSSAAGADAGSDASGTMQTHSGASDERNEQPLEAGLSMDLETSPVFGDLLLSSSPSALTFSNTSSPQNSSGGQGSASASAGWSSGCTTAPLMFDAAMPADGCFPGPAAGGDSLLLADDALSLRLLLETELTAAALEATMASSGSGAAPLAHPARKMLSRQLAGVLVDTDGLLFGCPNNLSLVGPMAPPMLPPAPMPACHPVFGASMGGAGGSAPTLMSQASCSASTCSASHAGVSAGLPPAWTVYGCGGFNLPAPAASSNAAGFAPTLRRMSSGAPAGAMAAPVPAPALTATAAAAPPSGMVCGDGSQESRLQQLKHQMVFLQAQVEAMRCRLDQPSCVSDALSQRW